MASRLGPGRRDQPGPARPPRGPDHDPREAGGVDRHRDEVRHPRRFRPAGRLRDPLSPGAVARLRRRAGAAGQAPRRLGQAGLALAVRPPEGHRLFRGVPAEGQRPDEGQRRMAGDEGQEGDPPPRPHRADVALPGRRAGRPRLPRDLPMRVRDRGPRDGADRGRDGRVDRRGGRPLEGHESPRRGAPRSRRRGPAPERSAAWLLAAGLAVLVLAGAAVWWLAAASSGRAGSARAKGSK